MDEIRGLSVRQPWAWAICAGIKRTENRTWATDRRGTIAIHASTSPQVVNSIRRTSGCELMAANRFEFGAIIGLADIVAIASYGPEHESDPFAEGPYCWTMGNGRLLRQPIPLKGKLNLFKIEPAIQQRLRDAETFTLDLQHDADAARIAEAMTPAPDPVQSYMELFFEYDATRKHGPGAAVAGERLVELAPDKAIAYFARGTMRLDNGDPAGCITDMRRGLELDPSHAEPWSRLAGAYTDIGDHAQAIESADRAVQLAPESFEAFRFRARAYFFAKDYEKSLADCERGIQLAPESFFARTLRAEVLAAMGDDAGAAKALDEAERLAPGEPYIAELRQRLS